MGTKAKPSSQAAAYRQVAPRQWLVGADQVGSFLRDVNAGRVSLDQRVDLNPLDPRDTGFEGALPQAGRRITASQIDKLLEEEGHFFRVLEEFASDTWGEGWRLESEDTKWVEEARLIEEALNLRGAFEEADLQHLAHGLSGVYLNLEESNADNPAEEPSNVRKFGYEGGVLQGIFGAQPIPRRAISKALMEADPAQPRFRRERAWVLRLKKGDASRETDVEVHWSRFIEFRQHRKPRHEWDGAGLGRRIIDSSLLTRNQEHSASSAYYQRAAPLLIIEFAPGAQPDQPTIDDIADEVDEAQRHDIQKLMALGFTVKALGEGAHLPDPGPFYEIAVTALSIDSGMPKRRLTGSAAGELASASEDTRQWNKRISRRQANWAAGIVRDFYTRLDTWGILRLPKKGFRVAWKDLGEPTAKERMDIEWKRGLAMYPYVASGIAPPAALVDYQAAEFELQKQRVVPTNVLFGQPVGGTPGGPAPGAGLERGQRRLDALSPSEKIMAPELRLVEQRFEHLLREALLDIGERLLVRLEESTAKARDARGPSVALRLRARDAAARARLVPLLAGDAAYSNEAILARAKRVLAALEQLDPDDPAVRILLSFEAPSDDLIAALEEALRASAEAGAQGTFRELGRPGLEGVLDETTIRVFRTVARSTGEATAASITAEIRRSIAEGLATGEGHAQLRERVLTVFDRLARYEAERIARTESMRAYNQGARGALRAAGERKFRRRAFDGACPICKPYDGVAYDLDDPNAPPDSLHPNDRCVVAAAVEAS